MSTEWAFRGSSLFQLNVRAFRRSVVQEHVRVKLLELQPTALEIIAQGPFDVLVAEAVEEIVEAAEEQTSHDVESVMADGTVVSISETREETPARRRVREPAAAPGPTADVDPFARAGWIFAPSVDVRDADFGHRVYQLLGGGLMIGLPQVVVRFPDGLDRTDVQTRLQPYGSTIVDEIRFAPNPASVFAVSTPPHEDSFVLADMLLQKEGAVYAEPDMLEYFPGRSRVAGAEPVGGFPWHLTTIDAPGAWRHTRGRGVRIAVLDDGFCLSLPALSQSAGDRSGWVRTTCGRDLAIAKTRAWLPVKRHGTACAGMALGRQLAPDAWCGVAPEATLLPIAIPEDVCSQFGIAKAIEYALAAGEAGGQGADVITCSLGPPNGTTTLAPEVHDALWHAAMHGRGGLGTPVFWAVANEQVSIESDQICSNQHVIAVGASTRDDHRAPGASGPALAFLAPGARVPALMMDGRVANDDGASYAAPCAAAIAALVLAARPDLRSEEVRLVMERTCDPTVTDEDDLLSHLAPGRVNARAAVEAALAFSRRS